MPWGCGVLGRPEGVLKPTASQVDPQLGEKESAKGKTCLVLGAGTQWDMSVVVAYGNTHGAMTSQPKFREQEGRQSTGLSHPFWAGTCSAGGLKEFQENTSNRRSPRIVSGLDNRRLRPLGIVLRADRSCIPSLRGWG